jgi:hypothetical protein
MRLVSTMVLPSTSISMSLNSLLFDWGPPRRVVAFAVLKALLMAS